MDELQQDRSVEQYNEVPFGSIQHDILSIPPTVAEIGHLWSSYVAESMANTFQKYMIAKITDPEYLSVTQAALELSGKNLSLIKGLFRLIHHPIPIAFRENDVNVNAPLLFDETSQTRYLRLMTKYVLRNYALAFSESTRPDIRQLFSGCIDGSRDIIQRSDDILLAKGVFPKSPYIVVPDKVEFVKDKDYYGSFFGSERSLNALEITSILAILDFKVVLRELKTGFAQVVKSEEIKDFFLKGIETATNHINALRSILEKDGMPGPEILDYRVTDSTESPFSDRLMLYHTTTILGYVLVSYGTGLSRILRKDIVATYIRLMAEVISVAKSGADLLIKNGWMEKIPETANRQELIH